MLPPSGLHQPRVQSRLGLSRGHKYAGCPALPLLGHQLHQAVHHLVALRTLLVGVSLNTWWVATKEVHVIKQDHARLLPPRLRKSIAELLLDLSRPTACVTSNTDRTGKGTEWASLTAVPGVHQQTFEGLSPHLHHTHDKGRGHQEVAQGLSQAGSATPTAVPLGSSANQQTATGCHLGPSPSKADTARRLLCCGAEERATQELQALLFQC